MDAVALVFILAVVVWILMSYLGQMHQKSARLQCASNLHSLGLANQAFAAHHRDFPMVTTTNHDGSMELIESRLIAEHYRSLRRELSTPERLVCPADKFRKPVTRWEDLEATNISYFVGLQAMERYPERVISGDNNLLLDGKPIPSGKIRLSSTNKLSWHFPRHGNTGNILLGDGSVQQISSRRLASLFAQQGITNEFLF